MKQRATSSGRKGALWWMAHGEVFVSAKISQGILLALQIEFHGELSRIPSLKNSKLPGKNFINPDTVDRLVAMQALFDRSALVYPRKQLRFDSERVLGLLVCSRRRTRFDLDNCAAAVKDWLEPPTKRGRGWGVGVIEDDSQLTVFPVHADQYGRNINYSMLILKPWQLVEPSFRVFSEKLSL